jgi:hypothetical protein
MDPGDRGEAHPHVAWRSRLMAGNAFLRSGADQIFDGFVRAVGAALGVPMAMLAFEHEDEWRVRAAIGPIPKRFARQASPCTIVAETGVAFAIGDLAGDHRFHAAGTDAARPMFRGYAGVPVALRGGRILGCLSAIDAVPRIFSDDECAVLEALGSALAANIERRLGLPSIAGAKASFLAGALEHTDDAVRIFRLDDDCIVDVTYQNRAALAGPGASTVELAEALGEAGGDILRAGARDGAIVEMRARRFQIMGEDYAVTVERDVTQHGRLEQAFDDAAVLARLVAERYASLATLSAIDAPRSDRRIHQMLEFVLRELRMGTAVFAIRSGSERRVWEAHGEAALRIAIPSRFIDAALTTGASVRLAPSSDAPSAARFSSESLLASESRVIAICLGRAHTPRRDMTVPMDVDFLRMFLTIAAGDSP